MAQTMQVEKEKSKVPGKKRGRPKKSEPKNTGGGLPFFNPYGGSKKTPKAAPKKKKELHGIPDRLEGEKGSTWPA